MMEAMTNVTTGFPKLDCFNVSRRFIHVDWDGEAAEMGVVPSSGNGGSGRDVGGGAEEIHFHIDPANKIPKNSLNPKPIFIFEASNINIFF